MRGLLGATLQPPPFPPPFPPSPPRVIFAASLKATPGEELALIALLALPLVAFCLCCYFCHRNRKHLSEAISPTKEEEHINGPREYPMPAGVTELKSGHYQGKYMIPARQGGKYEHELDLFIEVQKSQDGARGRAQLFGSALELRAGMCCSAGSGASNRLHLTGVADFARAKGVIRLTLDGKPSLVMFFEQVDQKQLGGRVIAGEAARMLSPLPFRLQWVSELGPEHVYHLKPQQAGRQQMQFMPDQGHYPQGGHDDYGHGGGYGGNGGGGGDPYADFPQGNHPHYPPYSDPQNPYAGDYPPPGYADAQEGYGGGYEQHHDERGQQQQQQQGGGGGRMQRAGY